MKLHTHTLLSVALTLCERERKKWLWSKHYSVAECLKVNAGNQKGNNWCDIHLVCVMHYKPWRQKKKRKERKKNHKAKDPVKPLWWPYNQCQSENRKRGTFSFFFFFTYWGGVAKVKSLSFFSPLNPDSSQISPWHRWLMVTFITQPQGSERALLRQSKLTFFFF